MQRLGRIVKDLRSRVPISAEAPGEKTVIPDSKDVREFLFHKYVYINPIYDCCR